MVRLEIELEPVAQSRARVNTKTRGCYYPNRSKVFGEQMKWKLREALKDFKPLVGRLRCRLDFYKKLKPESANYGDLDNLTKAVFDACNGLVWEDDRQVTELRALKHTGEPKIKLEVYEIGIGDGQDFGEGPGISEKPGGGAETSAAI